MEIDLTPQEGELLEEILEAALLNLEKQIRHADLRAFKERLKADEVVVAALLDKVRECERSALPMGLRREG